MTKKYTVEDIEVLRGLDAVRKRPGMYVGDVDNNDGAVHMFEEVLSNAIDASLRSRQKDIRITSVFPKITIEDKGNGIPFGRKHKFRDNKSEGEVFFEELHSGPTADDHAPHIHIGYIHGVGVSPVNALSEIMTIESWFEGQCWYAEYKRGKPSITPHIVKLGEGRGTAISFVPDRTIFENYTNLEAKFRGIVQDTVYLIPDISIEFLGDIYRSENGLRDLLGDDAPCFVFKKEVGGYLVDLAMSGQADEIEWQSWVNGARTQGGSHHDAIIQALNKNGWTPKKAMVHLIGLWPRFAGPCRDILELPDLIEPLRSAILEALKRDLS